MSNFNLNINHLSEDENVSPVTGCMCVYVEGCGREIRLHDHDFYEFFLVLDKTFHYINGRYEKLHRGNAVFIKPSDIHGIIYDAENKCDIINLSFSKKVMHNLLGYLDLPITVAEHIRNNCLFLSEVKTVKLCEKLKKSISSEENNEILLKSVIFELFIMLIDSQAEENVFPKWFDDLCTQMQEKENFCAGVPRMAELSGKSMEYVSRCMRKYLNMTASEFVNDQRLSYVASRLINTNCKITDLCMDAGFYSLSWFNRAFKKKYSMTPGKFRKAGNLYESGNF